MAKAKIVEATADEPVDIGDGKKITYTPIHEGDRPFVSWNGVRFVANKPVTVKDPDMIRSAISNPWFKVEGYVQAKRVKPTAEPVPQPGATAEVGEDVTTEELDKMIEVD
jgi:hypothetical protein